MITIPTVVPVGATGLMSRLALWQVTQLSSLLVWAARMFGQLRMEWQCEQSS
jgi:hypothetical protein